MLLTTAHTQRICKIDVTMSSRGDGLELGRLPADNLTRSAHQGQTAGSIIPPGSFAGPILRRRFRSKKKISNDFAVCAPSLQAFARLQTLTTADALMTDSSMSCVLSFQALFALCVRVPRQFFSRQSVPFPHTAYLC